MPSPRNTNGGELHRVVGIPSAVLLGLGSILGTGIFVSIGIATGVAGSSVLIAVVLAAMVATFNGLSSAQLAAAHPVSGGTYEYGYRYLNPWLGFTAGWMFVWAKTASAATAALGFAGYALHAFGYAGQPGRIALGVAGIVTLTAVVASGIRRSNTMNAIVVSVTLGALLIFCIAGLFSTTEHLVSSDIVPDDADQGLSLLHATALMFVAYTGYGRIATLGEEVKKPNRNIPIAIIVTLVVSMLLYVSVTTVALGTAGPDFLSAATGESAAPLESIARTFQRPIVARVVAVGAVTAMLGVLLNLLLGVSRVVLAMARRGDLPNALAVVTERGRSPVRAVVLTGAIIVGLTTIGSVSTTWSFSAFSVLIYYGLTNLAALRLPPENRRFLRALPWLGLVSCLSLAWFVPPRVWAIGLGVIVVGWAWHAWAQRR